MKTTTNEANVNLYEDYEVTIIDIGSEGQGICKIDGFTVFVKSALPEDVLIIKIIKINTNFAFGQIEKIITPSVHRIEPKCSISDKCGGCDFQNLSYDYQITHKKNLIYQCLKRIGKLENPIVHDTIPMANPYNYRNKMQYPVGSANNTTVIGFYKSQTHEVIPVVDCAISNPINTEILDIIKNHMEEFDIWPYDEKFHRGTIRHVVIRNSFHTKEIMVCIVVKNHKKALELKYLINHCEDLVKKLKKVEGMSSIVLNENNEQSSIIMGQKINVLFGKDYINDFIGDIKFNISPLSFFQVNPIQTKVLYDIVAKYANLTGNEILFDLYCGIGTIGLYLAKNCKEVIGVETNFSAIKDAIKNRNANHIENVTFYTANAEDKAIELFNKGIVPDVIVVDPPRKGIDKVLLQAINEVKPARIVYVSCNPATLARDVEILTNDNYEFIEATPVDMFPFGVHIETVVKLRRIDK